MPTRIRLQRKGKKRQPFYHIVIADGRAPRDGKFIERIGTYNPLTNPAEISINEERALYWLKVGAQPSDTARSLLSREGILLRNHLQIGVEKGAITQAQADAKFNAWKAEKDAKLNAITRDKLNKERKIKEDRLTAERKVNEARKEEINKRLEEERAAEEAKKKAEAEAKAAAEAEAKAAAEAEAEASNDAPKEESVDEKSNEKVAE
ncbi:MAG: 30S ribosomal protein S16 [Bacteroidales bacterium]|jgi:small subunit ribosomal protein S16